MDGWKATKTRWGPSPMLKPHGRVPIRPMPRTEKLKPKCMPRRGPQTTATFQAACSPLSNLFLGNNVSTAVFNQKKLEGCEKKQVNGSIGLQFGINFFGERNIFLALLQHNHGRYVENHPKRKKNVGDTEEEIQWNEAKVDSSFMASQPNPPNVNLPQK